MRKCQKCQKDFLTYFKDEDGKYLRLPSRKYCLDCSPYKKHNTKDLSLPDSFLNQSDTKQCSRCKKVFSKENFFTQGQNRSYCKKCCNEANYEYRNRNKQKMIDYKGGKCQGCGYNKCNSALEFHHINPEEKDFDITRLKGNSFETVKPELDKCILLCCRCHRELHAGILNFNQTNTSK